MATIFDPSARDRVLDRVTRLSPGLHARWGRMSAPEMVVHLTGSCRLALGEMNAAPKRGVLSFAPLRYAVIHWLPWPENAPTAPELIALPTASWDADVAALRDAVRRVSARGAEQAWPDHPAFGRMTGHDWGVLMYRHADHHLTQFGV